MYGCEAEGRAKKDFSTIHASGTKFLGNAQTRGQNVMGDELERLSLGYKIRRYINIWLHHEKDEITGCSGKCSFTVQKETDHLPIGRG